ncbi:TPA: restriction endonuclease subunit S [Streptococcus suis]
MSEVISLRSITSKIGSGATPKGGNTVYENSGIAFIRSQNVLDMSFSTQNLAYITNEQANKLNNVIVENNDILLNITGDSIARCTIVPDELLPARVNQHVSIIRCISPDYANYVCYYLQFLKPYLLQICKVGGTRNALTKEAIENLPIVIQKEYKKIGNLLSTIDQKITLNNQINEELEAMAKTLYDYWFVQFDFPDENGKPYKSSGGKMVYNDQLKREIPEGWGVKLLGELSTYVTDKISSNDLNSKNYIGTDNMLSNMKGIEQATYLPNSTLVNSFIPNDILIANIRPYFKKIWISDRTGGCSSDVLCLRANDKEICNYLFYSLARDDFFNYNVTGSKGSKMPRGDKAHIQKYSVLFSEKHALKFSKLVSNFISQKHLIYKQNQELSQLRDWLLPMLMNGQVKVE